MIARLRSTWAETDSHPPIVVHEPVVRLESIGSLTQKPAAALPLGEPCGLVALRQPPKLPRRRGVANWWRHDHPPSLRGVANWWRHDHPPSLRSVAGGGARGAHKPPSQGEELRGRTVFFLVLHFRFRRIAAVVLR